MKYDYLNLFCFLPIRIRYDEISSTKPIAKLPLLHPPPHSKVLRLANDSVNQITHPWQFPDIFSNSFAVVHFTLYPISQFLCMVCFLCRAAISDRSNYNVCLLFESMPAIFHNGRCDVAMQIATLYPMFLHICFSVDLFYCSLFKRAGIQMVFIKLEWIDFL